MKKIDVLWLVEHKAREMDLACAVKSLVQSRYGIEITIRNMLFHAKDVMRNYMPSLVVFPYFYRASDALIEDYIQIWPRAIHFNLAMEQVHYKAHLIMKAPGDDFTRRKVIHHAWGEFYKNYLVKGGVPTENIFVNGNPIYQLYKNPYYNYFRRRIHLAQENGLDPTKEWVFIPENYKWAFFSDAKLQASAKRGGNLEEHIMMRTFCRESLAQLLQWCNETGNDGEFEIIFRPRPAINSQLMLDFFRENVDTPTKHLHFTKAETVRDWILASDVIISSYSTSLIESAIAGKPIYMVEPIPIPESLYCDWYGFVRRIHNRTEFEEACLAPIENNNYELRNWAQNAMLSNGDPIKGLADFIASLVGGMNSFSGYRTYNTASHFPALASWIIRAQWRTRRLISFTWKAIHSLLSAVKIVVLIPVFVFTSKDGELEVHPEEKVLKKLLDRLDRARHLFTQGFGFTDYFNPVTHENDEFTEAEINERVEKWHEVLAND